MRPSDSELLAVLSESLREPVRSLTRTPYRYATSHAIEELHLRYDSFEVVMLFKDLGSASLLPDAPAKPPEVQSPEREIETYRRLLAGSGIAPRCHAAVADDARQWLFLEKVAAVELWQVGDEEVWESVAGWLAGFHDRFHGRTEQLCAANPQLLRRDDADFCRWRQRALTALENAPDGRARQAMDLLGRIDLRHGDDRCFVHGELYPSNVLVAADGHELRVWPVDWEMAATGPPSFDLAALVTGWDEQMRHRMIERYHAARTTSPPLGQIHDDVERARVHLATQWLGWVPGWRAPAAHDHDWIGELLDAGKRLGA